MDPKHSRMLPKDEVKARAEYIRAIWEAPDSGLSCPEIGNHPKVGSETLKAFLTTLDGQEPKNDLIEFSGTFATVEIHGIAENQVFRALGRSALVMPPRILLNLFVADAWPDDLTIALKDQRGNQIQGTVQFAVPDDGIGIEFANLEADCSYVFEVTKT